MIRVDTEHMQRTIYDMRDMFNWCVASFGPARTTWKYGREPGFLGSDMCSGPEDIEWIDFENDSDAVLFQLKWQLPELGDAPYQ